MARVRSPNYPALSLESAMELAQKLYDREKSTAVSHDVVAKAWGYKGVSGPVRTKIGALKQYGLIGQSGKDIQVTDRFRRIILSPKESQGCEKALRDAALEPKIFHEIHPKYLESSDDALFSYLVLDRNFTEDAAKRLIKAYRANIKFAKLGETDYITHEEAEREAHEEEKMIDTIEKHGVLRYSWQLSKEVIAEVRLVGQDIKPSHFDMLSDYINLTKAAFQTDEEREDSTDEETGEN